MDAQIDQTRHHRILTFEEETALTHRIRAGGEDAAAARETFITHNLRLVHKIARHYHSDDPATEYDDLVQVGVIGLMRAIDDYDPDRGNRFATYAFAWIRQYIARAVHIAGTIRRTGNPHHTQKTEWGKRQAALRAAPISSLDAPIGDSDERTLADIIPADGESTEDEALNRIMVENIMALSDRHLKPRYRQVAELWMTGHNLEEIGKTVGASREMIRQTLLKLSAVANRRYYDMPRSNENKPCAVEGCNQPRMVGRNGSVHSRCEEHQREQWASYKTRPSDEEFALSDDGSPILPSTNGHTSRIAPLPVFRGQSGGVDASGEIATLRAQVDDLTAQVEQLRAVVVSLLRRQIGDADLLAALDLILQD